MRARVAERVENASAGIKRGQLQKPPVAAHCCTLHVDCCLAVAHRLLINPSRPLFCLPLPLISIVRVAGGDDDDDDNNNSDKSKGEHGGAEGSETKDADGSEAAVVGGLCREAWDKFIRMDTTGAKSGGCALM